MLAREWPLGLNLVQYLSEIVGTLERVTSILGYRRLNPIVAPNSKHCNCCI